MSARHRATEATEGEPSQSTGGSPASAVPVQETNILQILEQHLPKEHSAVVVRIGALEEQLAAAAKYREQLERIAADAGVALSPQPLP